MGSILLVAGCFTAGCTPVGLPPAPAPPPDLPPPSAGRLPAAAPPTVANGNGARNGVPGAEATAPLRLPAETGNVRALWIVRTALVHPDSARAAVARAAEAGFNTILVQVRGRGDAYHGAGVEPRAEVLAGAPTGFDPLATVLDEAHRRGLRVHAWVNVHVVASALTPPHDPGHLAVARPDLLAVPRSLAGPLFHLSPRDPSYLEALFDYTRRNADRVEGLYTSPSHPEVQDHLAAVVEALLTRYPVDGLHLDYLRYASPEFDFSRPTLEAFRSWVQVRVGAGAEGAEARWQDDPLAYVQAFPGLWDAFRTEAVTATMAGLHRTARRVRPEAVVSAAVFADAEDALRGRFQDWEAWVRDGIVDLVAPMAYSPDARVFEAQILRAAALDPRRVWAGLGVYQDTFEGAVGKALAARSLGVGGLALFSYDWAAGPEGIRVAGEPYLTRFAREVWGADR